MNVNVDAAMNANESKEAREKQFEPKQTKKWNKEQWQ